MPELTETDKIKFLYIVLEGVQDYLFNNYTLDSYDNNIAKQIFKILVKKNEKIDDIDLVLENYNDTFTQELEKAKNKKFIENKEIINKPINNIIENIDTIFNSILNIEKNINVDKDYIIAEILIINHFLASYIFSQMPLVLHQKINRYILFKKYKHIEYIFDFCSSGLDFSINDIDQYIKKLESKLEILNNTIPSLIADEKDSIMELSNFAYSMSITNETKYKKIITEITNKMIQDINDKWSEFVELIDKLISKYSDKPLSYIIDMDISLILSYIMSLCVEEFSKIKNNSNNNTNLPIWDADNFKKFNLN